MNIKYLINDTEISKAELSAHVIKHAHEWYEWADRTLVVVENGGDYFSGGSESYHREVAFMAASEFFNIDYDMIYDSWIREESMFSEKITVE